MKKPKRKKDAPRKATAIDAYIGDRMRERRQLLRMAQADLAEALGISKQQVQKYEIGQNRVSAARFFGICRVLKISLISMEGEVERGLRGAYFTIEDDGRPAIVFHAERLAHARELKEQWLRNDLSQLKSNGEPVCRPTSKLGVRVATAEEIAAFVRGAAEAKPSGDETVIIYLVELDGVAMSWTAPPPAGTWAAVFIAPIPVSLLTILERSSIGRLLSA
jgi:transcriptional regulator with XRE-family HTH domain